MTDSIDSLLNELVESIQNKEKSNLISEYEKKLSEKISDLAENSQFYKLPTANILSIINQVDFSKIKDSANLIQKLIKNMSNELFLQQSKAEESSTNAKQSYESEILLLKAIRCENCDFSLDDCLHILLTIKDCEIFEKTVHLIRELQQNMEKECEARLQEKENELKELREKVNSLSASSQYKKPSSPMKKPLFYEPDVFKAVEKGKLSSVQYHIEHDGVDVNLKNDKRQSLVYLSLLYKQPDVYSYLVSKGAAKPKFIPVTEKPENYEPDIFKATKEGKLSSVQYLIEQKGVKQSIKNKDGWTLLHNACFYGHLSIVKYLVEVHCVDEEAKDNDGLTPLHIACRNGFLKIVKYLCETGVNKNVRFLNGSTPLHFACQKGHLNIVQYLCEAGADKESINNDGWAPLHWACDEGHLDVVKYLIEKQNVNKEIKFPNGSTPLDFACQKGHLDIVQYLIEQQHVNKNNKSEEGFMPIHWACDGGNVEVVKYLIEKQGANKEERTNEGSTPLHIACYNGHLPVVQYLIEVQHVDKESKDNSESTPLHVACKRNKLSVIQYLIQTQQVNMNPINKEGKTPFDLATNPEIVNYLTSVNAL